MAADAIPGTSVRYAEGAGPDLRCYEVNCAKLETLIPEYQPQWTVRAGVEELRDAYRRNKTTAGDFLGAKYLRIATIKQLQNDRRLDADLRWVGSENRAHDGEGALV
jgi:hypothetical protein